MNFLAFWQKCVKYFWQSVDTILEKVSVSKQTFNAKLLIKRLPRSVQKITDTRVTRACNYQLKASLKENISYS